MSDEAQQILSKVALVERADANLVRCPQPIKHSASHVSIGDLHGNAMKLIYVLIEEGLFEIEPEKYRQLFRIYKKPINDVTQEDCDHFAKLIDSAIVRNNKALVIIGDELADRGSNDYFTLLVFNKLHKENVDFSIVLSNHGVEFINDFSNKQFTGKATLLSGQALSLTNMRKLIVRDLINEEEVRTMIREAYQPYVKAIDYAVDLDGALTLFTHAPVGLETVEQIVKDINQRGVMCPITYGTLSAIQLIECIEQLNKAVKALWHNGQLVEFIGQERQTGCLTNKKIELKTPWNRLIWNRKVGDELVVKPKGFFNVRFVHGHIGDEDIRKNGKKLPSHQNLDSSFGKGKIVNGVKHLTRHSSELSAKQYQKAIQHNDRFQQEIKFNGCCYQLNLKIAQLHEKYSHHASVCLAAKTLSEAITAAKNQFFTQPSMTRENLTVFYRALKDAIHHADDAFTKHRGLWFSLHPVLRACLGIVVSFTVIVPLALMATKQGYWNTFFSLPPTESKSILDQFAQGIDELNDESNGHHEKTELSA